MKYLLLIFIPLVLLFVFHFTEEEKRSFDIAAFRAADSHGCGPVVDNQRIDTGANGKYISALPGWGHYYDSVSTKKDSAQFFFNQGLSLYYSYHLAESVASFKEAARFDDSCAMTWWGQALAMGPYYNAAHTYKMNPEVLNALAHMNADTANTTAREKELIAVMNLRYSNDTTDVRRPALNLAYAEGLKKAMSLFPDDVDIQALYIDAMMLMHAWDFWYNDGQAKSWTPELVKICQNILKKSPDHPAALHYYMHLTEASRHPEVALGGAEKLKQLFPGVAHMVHMASHEYERNGLFPEGVEANDLAYQSMQRYHEISPALSPGERNAHYTAVQAYCALSGGMYDTAMRDALLLRKILKPTHQATNTQHLYMMPVFVQVRFGKWADILADTTTLSADWPDAQAIHHFARGMAQLYTGHTDSAERELVQLHLKSRDSVLLIREIPFNKPIYRISVAENILQAGILFAKHHEEEGISILKTAIRTEDSLIYFEPKDWMIPARQYLGAYFLKLGKPALAEETYRQDLIWNPNNGWSLLGIYQSLKARKKNRGLESYRIKYEKAFAHATAIPPGSVYMN